MARKTRSKSKKTRNHAKATDTLRVIEHCRQSTDIPAPAHSVIDVPFSLSLANRRLYRQMRTYKCKVTIDLTDFTPDTPVAIYAIAPTWYNYGAMKTAKNMYDAAVEDIADEFGTSKWNDFRLNTLTGINGGAARLTPVGRNYAVNQQYQEYQLGVGEYENTEVVDESGVSHEFTIYDPTNATNWSIWQEYDNLNKPEPRDPDSAAIPGYAGLVPAFNIDNVTELQANGNFPPYDPNSIPNGVFMQVGLLEITTGGAQKLTTGWFDAPLGHILMYGFVADLADGIPGVVLEVAEGDYKGVEAPAIM